jgi:hypothetical protein
VRRLSWIVGASLALAGLTGQGAAALPVCALGAPYTFRAGVADEFADPVEATSRGAALNAAFPAAQWKGFNDATSNHFVGHTFTGLPADITRAELVLRVKPHADTPSNDSVNLGLLPPNLFAASFHFADLPEAHGTWEPGSNGPTTFTLTLGVPYQALLGQMSSQHALDVLVQDDSAVDFLQLRVWVCPPPVAASGLPNQAVGSARIAADGQGGFLVSGVGPGGGDGVKVQVGQSSLVGLGLSALADAPVGSFLDLHAESATTTLSGRLRHETDSWSFVPDPDAQGAAVSQVQIYDADRHLVGAFPAGSDSVHFDSPPQGMIIQGFDRTPFRVNPDPNRPFELCNPATQTTVYICGTLETTDPANDLFRQCELHGGVPHIRCDPKYIVGWCWSGSLDFSWGPRHYTGSCLYWTPGPSAPGPFGNLRVTSNTDFAVTREQLGISGFAASALGGTTVDESDSGLRLSNLGPGSGVALDTGRTATAHVFFAPIDPARASTSAALQAEVTGSLDGTPDQPLGTFRATHGAGSDPLAMTASFAALGAATQRVEVYDQGRLVTAVAGASGPVGRQAINVVVIWPVALEALSGGGFGLTWTAEGRFTLPNGQTATGDELRLLPETSASASLDYITGLALHPSGLAELTIADVRAASCAPEISRQPANVTTAAGRPAVFSVSATSASPLTFRWRRNGVDLADGPRIAGSATASLTLSPTILALAGTYDVVVSNSCGSVVSTAAAYTPGVALRNLLLSLLENVQSLVDAGTLSAPQGASLSRSLLSAAGFLQAGRFQAAANRVDVFVVRVNAFVHAGALSPSQGKALTDAAAVLRARLVD